MPRGESQAAASYIASVYLTVAGTAGASGTALGDPCEFAVPNMDEHRPVVGQTVRAFGGTAYNTDFSLAGFVDLHLILTVYDRALREALDTLFATSAWRATRLYLRRGTLNLDVKPDRTRGPVWAADQDHNWTGAEGRDLNIFLAGKNAVWSAP